MKLEAELTTLVIAGAWNPAIVTPNWIAHHVLGFSINHEFQVLLQMPVQGFGMPPRFSFEGLTLTAQPEALIFALDPNKQEQVQKTVQTAATILELLTHTPISAVGVNLTISLDAASHLLTSSFETSAAVAELTGDDDPKVVNQEWKTGIKLSDHLLNLSCIKSGGQTKLIFNHHFEAGSAPNAARVLKDNALFSRLKHLSETIATQLESGENNVSQSIIL